MMIDDNRIYQTVISHSKDNLSNSELYIVYSSLLCAILLYLCLLCFICFNFYRIMIKQGKITLIPLTIFYACSTIIVLSRITNNSAFFRYYVSNLTTESQAYIIGIKTAIVSSYFNLIMGFFQVASIFELFFVCSSIQKAALSA